MYKIIISPLAQKEIENAIDYYTLYSENAPLNFIAAVSAAYAVLKLNPFERIRYKNIRAVKLKKFPYSLYFIIDENRNLVRILSCFHNKRNPDARPSY
jgi:plasmid stabilization system protein ParE